MWEAIAQWSLANMVRFLSSHMTSANRARNPSEPSTPEVRNHEEGLTLKLWLPHGGTQNQDTLFLKPSLEASVTLQQATTMLPVCRVPSKDRVKAARNRVHNLKSRKWAKSNQLGAGHCTCIRITITQVTDGRFRRHLEKPEQRKCSYGVTTSEHPLLTFGTYHLTAGFSCFILSP